MEEDFKEIMHSSSTAASLQQIMEVEEEELSDDDTSSFTGESSGCGSVCSSNSIVADDACSSSSCSLESELTDMKDGLEANGPLYELSSLLAQLPLRRGLSKFYIGKSQSFTSLSDANSIDDLAKKESTYSRRMKICRSYPGRLDKKQRSICPPTKVISKRQAKGSFGTFVPKMRRTLPFQLNSCGMPT